MKGILKGFIFTFILLIPLIAILTGISAITEIPDFVLKPILWSIICFCVFTGSSLVSRGAEAYKSTKGILCSLLSILALFVTVTVTGGGIPASGSFYALAIIIAICGSTGAFIGSRA